MWVSEGESATPIGVARYASLSRTAVPRLRICRSATPIPLNRSWTRGVHNAREVVAPHTPLMCSTPVFWKDGRILGPAATHNIFLVRSAYPSPSEPCKSRRGVVSSRVSPLDVHRLVAPIRAIINHKHNNTHTDRTKRETVHYVLRKQHMTNRTAVQIMLEDE